MRTGAASFWTTSGLSWRPRRSWTGCARRRSGGGRRSSTGPAAIGTGATPAIWPTRTATRCRSSTSRRSAGRRSEGTGRSWEPMSQFWTSIRSEHYVGRAPWTWVQLESQESPGPLPFLGGVAPEVVASLHEAHQLLLSGVETAISDVFSRRASLDDPATKRRLEDAYAELVRSRAYLSAHIRCG